VQIDEAVTLSITLAGTTHIEAKSYSDNVIPNKHYCDNSKHVSTEIPVLDKHSISWWNPRQYMTMQLSLLRSDWKSCIHRSSLAEQSKETKGQGVHYSGRTRLLKADWYLYRSHINTHRDGHNAIIWPSCQHMMSHTDKISAGNSHAAYESVQEKEVVRRR
jgi:hypothetical protein